MKRAPRMKANTIQCNYSQLPHNDPDYVVVWGEGCSSSDARVAMNAISKLGEELAQRGYDPKTIQFSIKRSP